MTRTWNWPCKYNFFFFNILKHNRKYISASITECCIVLWGVGEKILQSCGNSHFQRVFQTYDDSWCLRKDNVHPISSLHLGTWIPEYPRETLLSPGIPPSPHTTSWGITHLTYFKKWTMIQAVQPTKQNRVIDLCNGIFKSLLLCWLGFGGRIQIVPSIPRFYFWWIIGYKSIMLYCPDLKDLTV